MFNEQANNIIPNRSVLYRRKKFGQLTSKGIFLNYASSAQNPSIWEAVIVVLRYKLAQIELCVVGHKDVETEARLQRYHSHLLR
jgi:hypothetical protein